MLLLHAASSSELHHDKGGFQANLRTQFAQALDKHSILDGRIAAEYEVEPVSFEETSQAILARTV